MSRYNHDWIKFLSGYNVIKVTNEKEFDVFKNFLSKCGLLYVLNNDLEFKYWQHLAEINNKNPNIFLFEYHNEKGITWWDNIKDAEDYYGEKPIEVTQLNEFFDAVNKANLQEKNEKRVEKNNKNIIENENENEYDYN